MLSRPFALALALTLGMPPAGEFRPANPAHRWSFPADHRAHPGYRNEWWYFTGTVEAQGEPRRRLGFQLTFFRVGLAPAAPALDSAWAASDAVMVHAAVTDVSAGTHRFSEVLWRAVPLLGGFPAAPDPVLAWARAPPGSEGRWEVRLDGDGFRVSGRDDAAGLALDLSLRPTKPPALQGPNGISRKSADEGYASLYVSLPRLATAGTVTLDGRRLEVHGESWMDQEIGSSQLAPDQVGWDWWSLRLRDGRDLMLYVLRRKDGTVSWRNGTLVSRDGTVRLLAADEWTVRGDRDVAERGERRGLPVGLGARGPGRADRAHRDAGGADGREPLRRSCPGSATGRGRSAPPTRAARRPARATSSSRATATGRGRRF